MHVILVSVTTELLIRVAEGVTEIILEFRSPWVGDEVIFIPLGRLDRSGYVDPVGLVERVLVGIPVSDESVDASLCPGRGVTRSDGQLTEPIEG